MASVNNRNSTARLVLTCVASPRPNQHQCGLSHRVRKDLVDTPKVSQERMMTSLFFHNEKTMMSSCALGSHYHYLTLVEIIKAHQNFTCGVQALSVALDTHTHIH